MNNKITFTFTFVTIGLLHAYVLNSVTLEKKIIAVEPQKKVSTVINLQRVAVRTPEPVAKSVVEEVLPEPPKPVVEEVVVVTPKKIEKKAIKKVVKKKKIAKKKVTKKKVAKKKKKTTKPKKVAKQTSKAQRSSPKQKSIKNHYLAKVRKMIEQRKKYPKAAKRMRQEGVVKVKFTIGKNGVIRNIRLAGKCSYMKLNKAAMKILKKIRAFAPIPKELSERYLSLTVPIRYKILN